MEIPKQKTIATYVYTLLSYKKTIFPLYNIGRGNEGHLVVAGGHQEFEDFGLDCARSEENNR